MTTPTPTPTPAPASVPPPQPAPVPARPHGALSRARVWGAALLGAVTAGLTAWAAWPIYETAWLLVVTIAGLVLGAGLAFAQAIRRISIPVTAAIAIILFAVTVVPVARPQSFSEGLLRGIGDALSATVLGWKQLLTLTLPVGGYQAVLVPAYVVVFVSVFAVVRIALARGKRAVWAALPLFAPIAFGTVFGSSVVSAPTRLGPLAIWAPRETAIWLTGCVIAAVWIVWVAGAERRAALRLGRRAAHTDPYAASAPGTDHPDPMIARASAGRRGVQVLVAAAVVIAALGVGSFVAPLATGAERDVPRDRIDPAIVVREQVSPLATYRAAKSDAALDVPLIEVVSEGEPPARLRFAVLDAYDGVDFHVSDDVAGRFSRFPSGKDLTDPVDVDVRIAEGYDTIWLPATDLGAPPSFTGERAGELADALYVNPETGAAIAVPEGDSGALRQGDGYTVPMERDPGRELVADPLTAAPRFDLETAPELVRWVERQDVSADAEGLTELIERLRERGYLSHAIAPVNADGAPALWLERLSDAYGVSFEPSAGGHSLARIEELFAQLNTQEQAAGEQATPAQLVAGIGDDEQFATAAALVARALGYDSRVVIGVRLDNGAAAATDAHGAGVPGVPACSDVCTGEHLAAWVEVRGNDGAWVPVDVSPQVQISPERIEEGEQLPEFTTVPEERDAREVDPPVGLSEQSDEAHAGDDAEGASWVWPIVRTVLLILALLVCLLVPFLFLPLAKRVRARRRRAAANPELSALGAWEELLDRARDARARFPETASRPAIAAALGTAPAAWAAEQVDRAVFSAESIDRGTADWVWAAVDEHAREQRADMTRWQRIRAAYSLRSLWRRPRKGATR